MYILGVDKVINFVRDTGGSRTGRKPYFSLTINEAARFCNMDPGVGRHNTCVKRTNIGYVHIYPLVHFKYIALK